MQTNLSALKATGAQHGGKHPSYIATRYNNHITTMTDVYAYGMTCHEVRLVFRHHISLPLHLPPSAFLLSDFQTQYLLSIFMMWCLFGTFCQKDEANKAS